MSCVDGVVDEGWIEQFFAHDLETITSELPFCYVFALFFPNFIIGDDGSISFCRRESR
jgi:hypothetical protein